MISLFISDLHLSSAAPQMTQQFVAFLQGEALQAQALYILGDLFEFWVGDDDTDATGLEVQQALRELTQAGVPCYLMHGNRDFLLGKRFCERSGCQLLADGSVVTVNQQRILLLHGDVLCTDDRAYQRLRKVVRNPLVQWLFNRLPLARRQTLAMHIRESSRKHTQHAHHYIMDVNQRAVALAFEQHQVRMMIHGHTHRPAIHAHQVKGEAATRIVLGDWYTQGSVLRWNENGFELATLPR